MGNALKTLAIYSKDFYIHSFRIGDAMKFRKTIAAFVLPLSLLVSCAKEPSSTTQQTVKISMLNDPQSLDPRLVTNLPSTTILHMLFEGLMRSNFHGQPVPALAEKVDISPDLKTYTFHLKKTFWSNGDPLTAYDFERSWKSILDPKYPAPNAYQLYVIKGAKAFKEGTGIELGLHAQDDDTLIVELEHPTPYFLQLTASYFFYPVKSDLTNGPFKLESWKHNNELTVVKNDHYWDAENVSLNKIIVYILEENTALQMHLAGELDWAGSPASTMPQDAVQTLKEEHRLSTAPAAGTHWFRFNTEKPPFDNLKIRKAFSLALNRKAIVDHVTQGNEKPAMAIVPPLMHLEKTAFFDDNDTTQAWELFQEALVDLNTDKDHLPLITLCYQSNDRNNKIAQAVQQQWKKAFDIEIKLENCESKHFYDKLNRKDYQIGAGSWFADFNDPINFLEVFKYRSNSTNNTQWENPEYTKLLAESASESDSEKRNEILTKAQTILMNDMPIAPLFFSVFNFSKNRNLQAVYVSDLGYLDFKDAYWGEIDLHVDD